MARKKHLVGEHLENVDARFLEDYQDVIREYVYGKHGIYALYKNDRLYYVGLASNMRSRLTQHLRDRHQGRWNRFSIYLVNDNHHTRELESLLLRIVNPQGNRRGGKLVGSINLRTEFSREVRARQRQEVRQLLGKRGPRIHTVGERNGTGRRRRRLRDDDGVLAPHVDRARALRAWRNGWEYRAQVRRDGWIYFGNYLYRSPSAAAKAAVKRPCNGWAFWHYQKGPGEWVPLKQMRRGR